MANQEQFRILEQGAEIWNQWRKAHLTDIDLNEADLRKAKLRGANLMVADLTKARLGEADLGGARLVGADLTGADLTEASLYGANLSDVAGWDDNLTEALVMGVDLSKPNSWVANLMGADLTGADLREANLREVFLTEARLQKARLAKANLRGARLWKTDFSEAQLEEANLRGADLRAARLTKAKCREANLWGADLRGTDLTGADLAGANLTRADLTGADLTGANLKEADLTRAGLKGANLTNSRMGMTIFGSNDLGSSHGLETTRHAGPSTLGMDTIRDSKGKLPVEFLRGCGLNDWEIEALKLYQPDLNNNEFIDIQNRIFDLRQGQSLQISPLFISYSRADKLFVDKLEIFLDQRGIRFWRDIHDAIAGRIDKQIDRAIRQNPTVLLVLSEHSIKSDWVEHEVRLARELEKELERDVICPIALDNSWQHGPWPRRLMEQVLEYNILDYSGWENDDEFRSMFGRLVDGLNLYYQKDK